MTLTWNPVKELKVKTIYKCRRCKVPVTWNPVKELKDVNMFIVIIRSAKAWNPVKELKAISF